MIRTDATIERCFRPISVCGLLVAWSMLLSGCGGGSAPLPTSAAARQALQTALEAWKAGKPASGLVAEKPSSEVVDFEWKAGKKLVGFTIEAETPGQGTQTFAATLTLQGDPAPKSVQYMALGLDPIRIYRDEDFRRALNMDNAPAPPAKPRR